MAFRFLPAGSRVGACDRLIQAIAACLVLVGVHTGWAAESVGPRRLVWSDDFNQPVGSAPDGSRWTYDRGAGGWGNRELQTYTDSRENSVVVEDAAAGDGRALAIRATRSATGAYASARLTTKGKFAVTYGRIEARLRLTHGRGLWPAFWMLGEGFPRERWPACGEIDIMEQVGHEPGRVHGTLHGPGYAGSGGPTAATALAAAGSLSDAYHVFAVEWGPEKIEWSLDGRIYTTVTPARLPAGARWVFDRPMFLLLNLAVGGNWPGAPADSTVFPQSLLVDYVRVYARPETAAPP